MQNNKFKAPLLQSAAVLAAVVVLVLIVGSSGSSSAGGGIVALFSGIGNGILFAIGMGIALAISIAILIGIFLAAVAMVDSDQATKMYEGLKKNFAASLLALSSSCDNDNNATGISEEEYAAMKEELAQLQGKNSQLQQQLDNVVSDNSELKTSVTSLDSDKNELKAKIDELSGTVLELQGSEKKINELVANLSKKIEASNDQDLKNQIGQLEKLQTDTKKEIEAIGTRLAEIEAISKEKAKAPKPVEEPVEEDVTSKGIFSYIEKESDKTLFIEKVEEAVILEMTYAQIDEHLTESLPADLDQIIKDHPSLTKDYIRSVRS
jgi:DNA repair exonuclease SbcCD ATPase subunit